MWLLHGKQKYANSRVSQLNRHYVWLDREGLHWSESDKNPLDTEINFFYKQELSVIERIDILRPQQEYVFRVTSSKGAEEKQIFACPSKEALDEWLDALLPQKKEEKRQNESETPWEDVGPQTVLTKLKTLQYRVNDFLSRLFAFSQEVKSLGTMLEEDEEKASEFFKGYSGVLQEISTFKLECIEFIEDVEEQQAQQITAQDAEQFLVMADTLKQTAADKWDMSLKIFAGAQMKIRAATFQGLSSQISELRQKKRELDACTAMYSGGQMRQTGSSVGLLDRLETSPALISLGQLEASEVSIDVDLEDLVHVQGGTRVVKRQKNTRHVLLLWSSVVVLLFGVATALLLALDVLEK